MYRRSRLFYMHKLILFLEQVRELGDRRRIARPVDPDHQDDLRARKSIDVERLRDGAQHRGDFLGDDLAQFLGAVRGDVAALGEAAGMLHWDMSVMMPVNIRFP